MRGTANNGGGVRVLLANPRRERRLLRFLKESEVGKIMGSGEDENQTRAARMDVLFGAGVGSSWKDQMYVYSMRI
jgi:hypothetical protein